jgi:ubiquinone biosynthesis protein
VTEARSTSDREWGNFTEEGPWNIDRSAVRWLPVVDELRALALADVPKLTTPQRLPPGVRVLTVARHIAGAIAPWYISKKRGRFTDPAQSRSDLSLRLRRAVETLGPTYIKLGQIISSGEGLFPAELVEQFKLCRDQVPAEDFATVRLIV